MRVIPNAITELEKSIDHFYQAHSAKRVVIAALLVGVVSIGMTLLAYSLTFNVLMAIGMFALCSLLMINIAILAIVPTTLELSDSKALIMNALMDSKRIQTEEGQRVKLIDDDGRVHTLSRVEQALWDTVVVAHFIKISTSADAVRGPLNQVKPARPDSNMPARPQSSISVQEQELIAEREKLEHERAVQKMKSNELRKMQDQLENRMSRVEASRDELDRLKQNLESRLSQNQTATVEAAEFARLEEKVAKLKARKAALELVNRELRNDRDYLKNQKLQLDQIRKSSEGEQAQLDDSGQSMRDELGERERELEERMRYVASVEDDLIDRLSQLSQREAEVEQVEVEVGLRED
jgi:myosin heavy subunit